MLESLVIALIGGGIGTLFVWALHRRSFGGVSATSTLSGGGGGGGKNFAVKIDIDPQIVAACILLTLVMGRVGGLVPSLSAMRAKNPGLAAMTDFLQLVCDALGLMNDAFLRPSDPQSHAAEFYHQFRKLWDRGIPVGMGLGHLLIFGDANGELSIVRRGEGGRADELLAILGFTPIVTRGVGRITIYVQIGDDVPPMDVVVIGRERGGWRVTNEPGGS